MKNSRLQAHAFTLVEMIVAGAITGILSAGVMIYSSSAIRMVTRNLATNHSHESARGSLERLFSEVHNSASRFQLINFNGITYTDVAAVASSDKDAYTQQYVSNRANGVRFMRLAAGPCKITGNGSASTVAATDTTLELDVTGGTYTPSVGDKLQIPLISHEFNIIAPAPVKTSGNKWKVTLSSAIGFSILTASGTTTSGLTLTNPISSGYFYQRCGYTVVNNQLRFHPNLTDPPYPATAAANDVPVVIKSNITSPKPFGLLFPTSTSTLTDATNLRVSLEAYDLAYSARLYQNATTTLQVTIPSRNQPPVVSGN
ncbi:MAG: type II secretion system protein [Chthoniobacter sp.]|uniref:type II secretion system protein n=1 Tax=Chthoniobacter sp. TaxID=2510640 RepID=UPI0032A5DF1E